MVLRLMAEHADRLTASQVAAMFEDIAASATRSRAWSPRSRGSDRPTYTPHINIRHPETLPVVF
jgi:hypothetical protein